LQKEKEKRKPFYVQMILKNLDLVYVKDLVYIKIIVYIFKYSSFLHRGWDGGRELWALVVDHG
jgi:hypothetical protein